MNLKNNYLLKKLLSEPIKNVRILIFTMLYFFKQIKKNTWRYHYFTSPYQKSWWYDLQFLRYRVWQTEIGNDGSFFALLPHPHKNPTKNEIWKNEKKLLEISSFYTNVPKATIIWVLVPEIQSETQNSLSFWAIFGPFTPPPPSWQPGKSKFWKTEKSI